MRLIVQIQQLRERVLTASPAQLPDLEREARALLADAKNTPLEAKAQELFSDIARLTSADNGESTHASPAIRGLVRRARIRVEMAGDPDDITEAIDILTEAMALDANDEDVINLLVQAANNNPQAAQRVQDLFNQHEVERNVLPPVPEPEAPASDANNDAPASPTDEAADEALEAQNTDAAPPVPKTSSLSADQAIDRYVRRARIRLDMVSSEDDVDEALDVLGTAIALDNSNPQVIDLLQQAATHGGQAARRVRDLFARYNVDAPMNKAPQAPPPAPEKRASTQPGTPQRPPSEPAQPLPPEDANPARPVDDTPLTPDIGDLQIREPRFSPGRDTKRVLGGSSDEDTSPQYVQNPPQQQPAPQAPPPQQQMPPTPPAQTAPAFDAELEDLMAEITEEYYAGNYQRTIELANRILARDPNNKTAQEYRQKSEDNLIRGVVPDHRIPFDARVSYNRANSLVRAGNYEEASKLYREAREIAERDGILSWKDVEQALLDIQDLALARELMNEGDRLLDADNWAEAVRKYEGALRVVPNDPQVEERLNTVLKIQKDSETVLVELSLVSGTLDEQVQQLLDIRTKLARMRQLLPSSTRLVDIQQDVDSKLTGVRSQLHERARAALERVQADSSINERINLTEEAIRLAEFSVELNPGDSEAGKILMEARAIAGDLQRAKQSIDRSSKLVIQNLDSEIEQAREMLSGLSGFAQDERYRLVVNDLFNRYQERAEIAIEEGDVEGAQRWMTAMNDDPFRILGRRAEVVRLETQIRGRHRRRRTFAGGIIIIIIALLGGAAFAARPQIEAALFPTETPTPTITLTPSITPTATATNTPTATPTPSDTPTATDTATWTVTPSPTYTPSWTPTPSQTPTHTHTPTHTNTPTATGTATDTPTITSTPTITPTPPSLCEVFVATETNINLRAEPDLSAGRVSLLGIGDEIEVTEQILDESNIVWYRVRVLPANADEQLIGWVRSDTVEQRTQCPFVPGADN